MKIFVKNLIFLMKKYDISAYKIFKDTKLPQTTLSDIIKGKTTNIKIENLIKILTFFKKLNISADDFLFKDLENESKEI